MIKKLTKFGNSMAVILDKPLLEILNILPDTELKISTDGKSLIITPILDLDESEKLTSNLRTVSKNNKLQELHKKNIEKYSPALSKLSK